MATSVEITSKITDGDLKIVFTSIGNNFTLGQYDCFNEHIKPRINIEGIGLSTDGDLVVINITSQWQINFEAKALADITGVDVCVTKMFGIDIDSDTKVNCNLQAYELLKQELNW